ncbi:MAG: response regulator, partial [Selenomonadaceae bacterium]|nr:response regulator [Selenomonadaceae bacterium]
GMTPEFAKKVFEAYSRDRTVNNIQGTGLGMAITKSIVELMGGTIEVKTEYGKGTEFIVHVDFPLVEDVSTEKNEQNEAGTKPELDFSNMKLLLVEDNMVNREIASLILTEYGFMLDTAENGKEAVNKVAASKPGDYQAVLMDIQMPVMNGYEATKAIRALNNPELANIPIIAMTANAFKEDIQAAKDAGMNSHIAKPIDIPQMLETLTEVLK